MNPACREEQFLPWLTYHQRQWRDIPILTWQLPEQGCHRRLQMVTTGSRRHRLRQMFTLMHSTVTGRAQPNPVARQVPFEKMKFISVLCIDYFRALWKHYAYCFKQNPDSFLFDLVEFFSSFAHFCIAVVSIPTCNNIIQIRAQLASRRVLVSTPGDSWILIQILHSLLFSG